MRIFQLAKELNIDAQEILDALDDMGVQVKSNLQVLADETVAELRELFKPKPKAAKAAPPREDAVKRAKAELETREKQVREAARLEAERKEAAKKAALEKLQSKRGGVPDSARGTVAPEDAPAAPAAPTVAASAAAGADDAAVALQAEPAVAERPTAAEPVGAVPAEPVVASPESVPEPVSAPSAPAPAPTPAAAVAPAPVVAPPTAVPAPVPVAEARIEVRPPSNVVVTPPPPAASRLGKAVIAPPPTTAKERAELLGRPFGVTPSRPGSGRTARSGGPGSAAVGQTSPGTGPGASPGSTPPRPERGRPIRPERPGEGSRGGGRRGNQPAQQTPVAPRQVEAEPPVGEVKISEGITVKDLAERMNRKAKDVIKKLFLEKKILATINHALDEETAAWVVESFGGLPNLVGMEDEAAASATAAGETTESAEVAGNTVPRPPVVTIMGHVDHGKTSLLDAIRQTRVAEREAGGITQHIGAYKITQKREGVDREIVFLDTPGHEAFTLMRARGARVTDIVVLVVAADDGVMPQTIESINHAKAAGVPIVVAVNKIDKPNAKPERVLQQLADRGVMVEEYGGETVSVQVSAKQKSGIDQLLEMILLVADMQDLKSNPERPANGTVLEAKLDRARGPVATVLVQNGTLKAGDVFVVGSALGRVRALVDERDRRLEAAGPSTPVVVMGLEGVPEAGDQLQVFNDEAKARQIAAYRANKAREEAAARQSVRPSLENLAEQLKSGQMSEVRLVVKADVQGSVEVVKKSVEDLSTDEVRVMVIHSGTGAITETDIMLASASNAIVIGFNVRPERGVAEIAKREAVDVRLHTVIYNITDEIKQAMLATLSPVAKEVYLGRAQVLEVFRVQKVGNIAGCKVVDGVIRRDAKIRLLRDNVVIHEGKIDSLKRFKDDAREVKNGFECGIGIERFNDIKKDDEIEAFVIEMKARESLETSATS